MVLLHHQTLSRKRPPSNTFVSPFPQPPPKIPKSTTTPSSSANHQTETLSQIDKMVSVLADAGCTLINPSGPPSLPSDPHKLRRHLHRLFSSDASLRSSFLSGFSSYILSPLNLRMVLVSSDSVRNESLVRVLLLVPSIQLDLLIMLLEKLPEYFDVGNGLGINDDVSRLILNQFRWLDFLVDSDAFAEKLLQVLSICPLHLKKEIIGSLPEIIGDQNNKAVVDSLEQMLQEDSAVIVPVLDSFSNLNLDDQLQEQVITIALSCIRTIDAEHMPYLLRFLLLSATPANARRIISHIRQQLKFVGASNTRIIQNSKLKGKSPVDTAEVSILDALRSCLRFKNILCQEILKELKCLETARDHKVIDIWLLMLIYMNGESLQKSVENIFKKKIIEGCIQDVLFDQCIRGNKELVQDYFPSFLSLSECLLACKEQKPREFGIHIYRSLFEEFVDTSSRQEVLGTLVTHMGSGVSFEVSSALEAMVLLASKYSEELIPLSSHISGILDYLEGFSVENLHKVYEVFSLLALSARSSKESFGSSIANELLMIVRKQVSNPDLKYKKMGLIGTLKIVSCHGDANNAACSSSQKSNYEEALELLKLSMESCKQLPLPLILFYDELISVLDCRTLHPAIMEWIGKHASEFESLFLSDLEGGQLPIKDSNCGLEGELWMNLDGDISPVCLNILPLVSASMQSGSLLQILPAKFLLLSTIERLANQGSLGGIDALLGCPLHLPSFQIFSEQEWQTSTDQQKKIVCISLYYAANWIRELLNAFCTQVSGRFDSVSQATKEEIIVKLLKRLRNLVFLESLLNNCLKQYSLFLPDLYPHMEYSASSLSNQPSYIGNSEKKSERMKANESSSPNKKGKNGRTSKASTSSDVNGKFRQPTIVDSLRKACGTTSQEVPNEDSSCLHSRDSIAEPASPHASDSSEVVNVEISAASEVLEAQRYKFRPLLVDCFSILAFSKMQNQDSCCPDPAAELPLHLYLLRDLHCKLDYFSPPRKQFSARCLSNPPGFSRMTANEFLRKILPLFSSLQKHLNCAVHILKEGTEFCQEHWSVQSASAKNPDLTNMVVSKSSVCNSLLKEILTCFRKMLNLPDIQAEKSVLSDLLEAFQPTKIPDSIFSGMQVIPSPGNIDYLYCGAYSFLEGVLEEAITLSFTLASEVLLTLDSVITSVQQFLEKSVEGKSKDIHSGLFREILPTLQNRLGTSAYKLLRHNWDNHNLENGWKSKGVVQKILQIYLVNSDSTSDLLCELVCSILPQATLSKTTAEDDFHGFPTLCSATFDVWYRVMHEENLRILNKLVKEVILLGKPRAGFQLEAVEVLLKNLQKTVNVVVSLINMCRTHDKISVHAMAVKYGGKFVDSFLKVFDFLQTQFQIHNELIIQLVKELQKATRTLQTVCSEAKGMKQTAVTSKIPATKRSLERFLFHVKALLYTTSSGCTFWMGNLKHKDLMGQVVSSQAYVDEQNENAVEDFEETVVEEDQQNSVASEEERETE
ncbi:Fanconi anemia group D2 protein [Camellia lanceoleosa]|uniref:Fanconi anemia group D2 protein n=1 Tax=Camellia lanceoleosa TaxID=1840588 RepID=A0ACC0IM37_9ERIC|nr:Fanconi anemia group D2 protein [Camellia lanceoleosa]